MAPREQLRETVGRLREELASGEPLDAGERQILEKTLAEVAGVLEVEGEGDEEHYSTLVGALRDAAVRFEQTHPKLTFAIGAVADSLARLGV